MYCSFFPEKTYITVENIYSQTIFFDGCSIYDGSLGLVSAWGGTTFGSTMMFPKPFRRFRHPPSDWV